MSEFEQDFRTTRGLIREDLRRHFALLHKTPSVLGTIGLLLQPAPLAVVLYRINNWLYANRLFALAKLLHLIKFRLTCTEIQPGSVIGGGLVLTDKGIGIPKNVQIGRNLTMFGPSSITLGGMHGVDPSRDRVVLGDHCVIGKGARLLGPLRLGDEAQIKCNAVVAKCFVDQSGALLAGVPARSKIIHSGVLKTWNPLKGCPLGQNSIPVGGGRGH